MIWKTKGSLLTMHLILNLSQNFIVTDFGKLILFPFRVTLTSFQSNSITSQIKFHFNFTFSEVSVPIILNKSMLPLVLHNLIGTYLWASDVNNIILTAKEKKYPLNSFSFCAFRMTKSTKTKIDKLNIKIVYHCILQVHSIFGANLILSCLATTHTSCISCKTRLVPRVLSFMCLHSIYMTIDVATTKIIALTNRKI